MRQEKPYNQMNLGLLAGRGGGSRRGRRARSTAFAAAWGLGFGRSRLGCGHIACAGVIRLIKAGADELKGRGCQRALQNAVAFRAFLFQFVVEMLNNLKTVTTLCTTICI